MSIDFVPLKKIPFADLFDGRLEKFGIREEVVPDATTEDSRCLTDGRNYLWVEESGGLLVGMKRYAGNAPGKILGAIAEAFDVDIVSEYEPQYWGYETQAEWDAALDKQAREADDRFHAELLKYLRGEPHGIMPGTIGMIWAEIAKKLVAEDPVLLLPDNKERLLREMRVIYDRDHTIKVELSPEDLAMVRTLATHEDDLPSA
jgi:hypothetical protein